MTGTVERIEVNKGRYLRDKLNLSVESARSRSCRVFIAERRGLRKMLKCHAFHDYHELFVQIKGATEFQFPFNSCVLEPGDVLVVPKELPHKEKIIKNNSEFETLVIMFLSEYIQCHISREENYGIPGIYYLERGKESYFTLATELIELLIDAGGKKSAEAQTVKAGLLQALLTAAGKTLAGSCIPDDEHPKVSEVKRAVLSRLHQADLSVKQLADQIGCAPDYLSWLYHNQTGTSLKHHITQLRMAKAVDLLTNTDFTVSEISWCCGYKTPAYFSRLFSAKHGVPPREFRKRT
ncbi:MAG: helix-turn-helix domain-containing protein [Spirochaetia bacterium]